MKNLTKSKLTREQMKKVTGGTNKTLWACYSIYGGGFLANVCNATNPADPANHCSGMTCNPIGTCSSQFLCP
jgi:hypothetical protein